jgi:prepilin-type N-terminal cleavage/methylation domain-containing protein
MLNQKGFTLTELLVATGLSLTILASVYGLFRSSTHTLKAQEGRMEAHEYATSVLDIMVREIRNTGYFPTGAPCATSPANTAGIITATAQSFRFVYDADGNGACEEDISFTFDPDSKNIFRNTGAPEALTDGNATALQFTYYPQQTSGTAPAPYCLSAGVPAGCSENLSANLANVQQVRISVTVESRRPDADFGGQANVTMASTADLRNHGL